MNPQLPKNKNINAKRLSREIHVPSTMEGETFHRLSSGKLLNTVSTLGGGGSEPTVAIIYYLKLSRFQQQKSMRCVYKQDSIIHRQGKKQSTEAVSKWIQMLDLADKVFKAAIKNMLKELKDIRIKEFKQNVTTTKKQGSTTKTMKAITKN